MDLEEAKLTYTDIEIQQRDKFVESYLLDLDAISALKRCGCTQQVAELLEPSRMTDPYVLRCIREARKDSQRLETIRRNWCSKELVAIATNVRSPDAAKVQAISKFMEMHGIAKTNTVGTIEDNITITRLIVSEKDGLNHTHS
jgi:hypothetical protein